MPKYDTEQYDPPAPVAHVALRNQETQALLSDVPMLLDTGADVMLIPQSAIARLGLALDSEKRYELIGFDSVKSFAPVAQLDLIFGHKTFRGQFLVIDQPFGIIGRNILNAATILLDGPKLMWEEQTL